MSISPALRLPRQSGAWSPSHASEIPRGKKAGLLDRSGIVPAIGACLGSERCGRSEQVEGGLAVRLAGYTCTMRSGVNAREVFLERVRIVMRKVGHHEHQRTGIFSNRLPYTREQRIGLPSRLSGANGVWAGKSPDSPLPRGKETEHL